MITVSVKQFISAIEEADAFSLPGMNAGVEYIYNSIYRRLSNGEEVRLSEINYNAFDLEDVDFMRDIYSDVLEKNENRANSLTHTLCVIPPAVAAAAFV